jgi:signal transduction histidine kinase
MDSLDDYQTLSPARTAAIYLVLGMVALWLSDLVFPAVFSGTPLRVAQGLKAAVEVLVTAALVYGLVWYGQRSLRSANRRLERNDQILQVLLRLLRHNIRNDMNVIKGQADLARAAADDGDVEDSCHTILTTADELLDQTETVNNLRDMLEGTAETRTFDLAALVEDVLEEARRTADVDLRTSSADVDPVVVTANSLLPVALGEVIDNAVRYNETARPEVTMRTDRRDGHVDLHVADDGPGIPAAEREVLATLEESPLEHSSGLGLWFVYWTVSDSGGEVSIRERPTGGTEITLSLPVADEPADSLDRYLAR